MDHIKQTWDNIPERPRWIVSVVCIVFIDTFLTIHALTSTVSHFREINPVIRTVIKSQTEFYQMFLTLIAIKSIAMFAIYCLWHYGLDIQWQRDMAIRFIYWIGLAIVLWNVVQLFAGRLYG